MDRGKCEIHSIKLKRKNTNTFKIHTAPPASALVQNKQVKFGDSPEPMVATAPTNVVAASKSRRDAT